VALFPSVLAYLFWNRGVELVGASRAGLFINLIPVFAALLSALLLGEPPRAYHGIGLLLIAGGMLLAQR
jgi:drug/metabolite transporter (DMT)-like permease